LIVIDASFETNEKMFAVLALSNDNILILFLHKLARRDKFLLLSYTDTGEAT
jgi:hypothetical protein